MKKVLILLFILPAHLFASHGLRSKIYSLKDQQFISFQKMVSELSDQEMIIIGEIHNNVIHHNNQKYITSGLVTEGLSVNVGFEFVSWMDQDVFDQYQTGSISRNEFIKTTWGESNYNFDWYDPMIQLAKMSGGHSFGINAPRSLTSRVGKVGIDGLTETEKLLLPPNWSMGSDLYKLKFEQAMGSHLPPGPIIDRYFAAQSIWDASMSFYSLENMNSDIFVVIIGQFHAEYKLGTPARLMARDPNLKLAVIVQVEANGANLMDTAKKYANHSDFGAMGDYILVTP